MKSPSPPIYRSRHRSLPLPLNFFIIFFLAHEPFQLEFLRLPLHLCARRWESTATRMPVGLSPSSIVAIGFADRGGGGVGAVEMQEHEDD